MRLEQGFAVVDTGPLDSEDDILESVRRLGAPPNAQLDVDIACFGHGPPIIGDAGAALRDAAEQLERGFEGDRPGRTDG